MHLHNVSLHQLLRSVDPLCNLVRTCAYRLMLSAHYPGSPPSRTILHPAGLHIATLARQVTNPWYQPQHVRPSIQLHPRRLHPATSPWGSLLSAVHSRRQATVVMQHMATPTSTHTEISPGDTKWFALVWPAGLILTFQSVTERHARSRPERHP